MQIFGVDPGLATGFACLVEGGALAWCGLGELAGVPGPGDLVVIEVPQIYRKSKGDPNDLITLALQAGGYRERYQQAGARVITVKPAEWKGQVDKGVHNARVLRTLDPRELGTYEHLTKSVAPSKRNNVIDAIGLAKWAFAVELWRRAG
jgi:hypothetical protein